MPKKDISFSVSQFILDWDKFTLEDILWIHIDEYEKEIIWSDVVWIKKVSSSEYDERFVCFYYEWWDKYPYSEKVVNVDNDSEEENPRDSNMIELDDQLFVVLDVLTQRVYTSNQKQKTYITNWFHEKTWKKIFIKALLDKWEFLEKIKSISEVSFSAEPNLLMQWEALSKSLQEDIFGYGASDIKVTLSYKNGKTLKQDLKDKIKYLLGNKQIYNNISVTWKTDEKMEAILNMEEIINKIPMKLDVNILTKKFDPDYVFQTLIHNIKDNEE